MPLLGKSRVRNMSSLKGVLKRRRQEAAKVRNQLKGVEKRRSDMRGELSNVHAALASLIEHSQTVTSTQASILSTTVKMTGGQVTRIERALRKESDLIINLTTKVGGMVKLLKREDGAHTQAQQEMRDSRRSVSSFMDDTMRLVNDIAHEVVVVRPDVTDNLVEKSAVLGDDPFIVSSFFHLHTRPRDTAAAGVFQRRRGSSARRAAPPAIMAGTVPRAIKASDTSTPNAAQA